MSAGDRSSSRRPPTLLPDGPSLFHLFQSRREGSPSITRQITLPPVHHSYQQQGGLPFSWLLLSTQYHTPHRLCLLSHSLTVPARAPWIMAWMCTIPFNCYIPIPCVKKNTFCCGHQTYTLPVLGHLHLVDLDLKKKMNKKKAFIKCKRDQVGCL